MTNQNELNELNELTFEDMIRELKSINDQLSSDEISLDKAMELYERGVKLSNESKKRLQEAEYKVEELKKGQTELSNE
ncbi:exodeoxyribonuclease VII small subunit [Abyssicoccus albus]|uniref:Exodeoxyribonuclease 7 small subunit n=1 Tax=Abyssicoccus albus TaxID=1817405 RepID=A0A1Q1G189_9BACL|nr:exodeoxyribonuclease VII small subunit [Abyssicoccus albus]AQL56110.1 exodeoxyribonuclease VII small subunit [Abyssicoccus albus]RPF58074.1 exodeoxyribonuclease VII small subunit [Abyssicoccus albus]